MSRRYKKIETRVIRAGEPDPRIHGSVVMPIFQSANFEYAGESSYHDLKYIRLNNTPNHVVLHQKLASLENAEAALVTSSGMAAISTTLLTVMNCGDHFLAQDTLYGGTYSLITEELPKLGISYDFIDGNDSQSWEKKLRHNTRAIYVEGMTNPLLQVADHRAVVQFAKKHFLTAIIDNTFPTPVNFMAIEEGFDISIHSCTKYLNGHSDIVAGAVLGKGEWIERITHKLNHLGGSLDPHACYLLQRGLKTLVLRVTYQNNSALKIARFLENHPAVQTVHYPGLTSHPHHRLAGELFNNGFGGMFSFELKGGREAAERFLNRTTIPVIAPSLGSVDTLLTLPANTSHAGLSQEERRALGITDSLIRVSVGIEATEELIEDFERALEN